MVGGDARRLVGWEGMVGRDKFWAKKARGARFADPACCILLLLLLSRGILPLGLLQRPTLILDSLLWVW